MINVFWDGTHWMADFPGLTGNVWRITLSHRSDPRDPSTWEPILVHSTAPQSTANFRSPRNSYSNQNQSQPRDTTSNRRSSDDTTSYPAPRQTENRTYEPEPTTSRSHQSTRPREGNDAPRRPSIDPNLSPAEREWVRQKIEEGAENDHLDDLMGMIGLEKVKEEVLALKGELDVSIRQGTSMNEKNLNVALLGNPGTGKTTVARHYAAFLASIGVLPGSTFVETTGVKLANDGIGAYEKMLKKVLKAGGGAIFIDEAYQLTEQHNPGGRAVLDTLLTSMLDHIGKVVFIFAGYNKNMESFFEANPGLPSRIPHRFQFDDYNDRELCAIFDSLITKKWGRQMAVEGRKGGLYVRIAVRRVGRGRGREGFGNARAISNLFSQVTHRQAQRINKARRQGQRLNDFLISKEDLIGPDPSGVTMDSDSWKELQSMIGLDDVKASIQSLVDMVITNYHRELAEKEPMQVSLNRVFLGNPGTGKTSVAKLYGRILADLGTLSNGEVVVKNPSDFIGDVIGASETKTKAILENTRGKVLVIDEAYGLYEKSENLSGYKTAVIDTIVAEVQSTPGEDRCVLLLGYKDQMIEMFQNVNPGLSRRFAIENAFSFADFTNPQLWQILKLKLKNQDLDITPAAKTVALEALSRARVRPHFGNAGEVENMIGQAKSRFQTRQSRLPIDQRDSDVIFLPEDFDPEIARSQNASHNLADLFKDMVGMEFVTEKLERIQRTAALMKKRGMDYRAETPTTFVFKGPPGTGKTTIARKIGKVYYDMGFLSSSEVIECSSSELVAEYIGQTGPRVRKKFDQALGKVLFIDEAYRLAEGYFAKEAIDEIVDCLTKETYCGRLIVILAGYTDDINSLLGVNPGLASRFTEEVIFSSMGPGQCLSLLEDTLLKKRIRISISRENGGKSRLLLLLSDLCDSPGWGNARDVLTLAKKMTVKALEESGEDASLRIRVSTAEACITEMIQMNRGRSSTNPASRGSFSQPHHYNIPRPQHAQPPSIIPPRVNTATRSNTAFRPPTPPDVVYDSTGGDPRDSGVSDAVWQQLSFDKRAQEQADRDTKLLEKQATIAAAAARELEAQAQRARAAKDEAGRRRAEELRLDAEARRAESDRITAALTKQKEEEQREAKAQAKLQAMGVCIAGYRWIKQLHGYRCRGGAHFVSDRQLGL